MWLWQHGLSIRGCSTEGNMYLVQIIQNFCARIICKKYDCINTRGIDLVDSMKIQTIRQRRDYFLSVLIFKAVRGLAPHYLCNDVTMIVDVHSYNTRSSENMNLYVPRYTKEICERSFAYKGSTLWNDLPDDVKESSSLEISTLDKDSLHTMAFVCIVLHVPCFKPTHIMSLKFLYILFIYVCIS